ncbi:hypothetical protein [Otariodibacter oris]|uniref:Uncharacterized protein n=1 Tax=Otariodibacter oris TaxID=1032623 RepID=A0A420XHT3_9PAST|nr:hypothetical protein [Otariodibacter oris]QGM81343.1 hypothetical protein A6A10_07910 [Otariodibacter oris]RKR72909.1 hypothetical protein DES31_1076 [Otariodibacter oris]
MKKKILAIFLIIIAIIFTYTYPYSYWLSEYAARTVIAVFEEITFPAKRVKILSDNGFNIKEEICIPYKSFFGEYAIDIDLKDKSLKPFETKSVLLNNFDFYISIYNDKNQLLFYNTPQEILDKSRERYNSVILNKYTFPKSGCYKINVKGTDINNGKYKYLYLHIFIAHVFP